MGAAGVEEADVEAPEAGAEVASLGAEGVVPTGAGAFARAGARAPRLRRVNKPTTRRTAESSCATFPVLYQKWHRCGRGCSDQDGGREVLGPFRPAQRRLTAGSISELGFCSWRVMSCESRARDFMDSAVTQCLVGNRVPTGVSLRQKCFSVPCISSL